MSGLITCYSNFLIYSKYCYIVLFIAYKKINFLAL